MAETKMELKAKMAVPDIKPKLSVNEFAERFRNDPDLQTSLLELARHPNSRRCLLLLRMILENPGLSERLFDVLRPTQAKSKTRTKTEQ